MVKSFKIGNKRIGEGQPTFIIAEIGFLFQSFEPKGKFPGAKTLIDLAKKAGANAVKFQTFRGETITSPVAEFNMENTGRVNQRKLFKEYEIDLDTHAKIFKYARQKKILIFSTPSHPSDVDLLEKFKPDAHKVGSDDLTNIPFMKYVAKTKRPMIISTGLSYFEEVKKTVDAILKINKKLAVLHCVSNYPMKPRSANLKAMDTLKALNVPIGWSDHAAQNNLISFVAVARGACIVEKHFTNNINNPSPDSMVSATPQTFREMVDGIRLIESSLGDGVKRPTEVGKVFPENRKSIVAARDLKKGEIIDLVDPYNSKVGERDILIARPGHGINANLAGEGIKIKIIKNISAWEPIRITNIQFITKSRS